MTEIISKPTNLGSADTEDAEARKLMEEWGLDGDNDDDVSSVEDDGLDQDYGDYDDFLEKFRRDVNPGDNEIDHIILGTSNLEQSLEDFSNMTGSKPVMVVSLNGVGTKSARIAFEDCCFLEIIGPDPKQPNMLLGDKLSKIPSGKMVPLHYAIRSTRAQKTPGLTRDWNVTWSAWLPKTVVNSGNGICTFSRVIIKAVSFPTLLTGVRLTTLPEGSRLWVV